jgi:hypothetical protein
MSSAHIEQNVEIEEAKEEADIKPMNLPAKSSTVRK